MASYYDAVFRRQIVEPTDVDERNRAVEAKRGRWDQPDLQKNNSEDHWERIVDRSRIRGDVHGDKPPSLIDLPVDANISVNKPPVPVRTTPLWNEIMPQFNPFNLMNPMNVMDSAMFMGQYGVMGNMLPTPPSMIVNHATSRAQDSNVVQTEKRIIQLEKCTLYPPPANAPTPTSRERPLGCRTVFVGGLPESITEDIMKSIFTNYGEILTIRLSNRKFCHIRFENECSVDHALELSGYRLVMKGQELTSGSRLHVDYAQARDDQFEWEMKKRHVMREERRQQLRSNPPPSPPLVPHFSEARALSISEEIKADTSFLNAVQVVITWLERGDCNKRNVSVFYTIIQSTNTHVRRLLSEKTQFEEELQNVKDLTKRRMQAILLQFTQIEKVFTSASHKKVWDHFTKAQRKNIETWKKQAMALSNLGIDDEDEIIGGDEMDLSDDENNIKKTKPKTDPIQLQEENDHLKCELEAYRNEIGMMKASLQTSDQKDVQINYLQQQLLSTRQELNVVTEKLSNVQKLNTNSNDDQSIFCNKIQETNNGSDNFSEHKIKLLSLISIFLSIHPFGASFESIVNYVKFTNKNFTSQQIEDVLVTNKILFEYCQHDNEKSVWKLVNFS